MRYRVGKCLLKERLKDAGMTQIELAEKLNMHRSQVSEYANMSRMMSVTTLKAVSKVLRCNMEDLYEWIPLPPSKK